MPKQGWRESILYNNRRHTDSKVILIIMSQCLCFTDDCMRTRNETFRWLTFFKWFFETCFLLSGMNNQSSGQLEFNWIFQKNIQCYLEEMESNPTVLDTSSSQPFAGEIDARLSRCTISRQLRADGPSHPVLKARNIFVFRRKPLNIYNGLSILSKLLHSIDIVYRRCFNK